jgi:hypothetical protein
MLTIHFILKQGLFLLKQLLMNRILLQWHSEENQPGGPTNDQLYGEFLTPANTDTSKD